MIAPCFIDTNILVYAAKAREDDPAKFSIANEILQNESFCLSAQVLQEFYMASRRKNPRRPKEIPLTDRQAAEWVGWLEVFCEVSIDAFLVQQAIDAARSYQIHYWDAAILTAAARAKAPVVYTEDLNHGQHYGDVQVLNPFRPR